MSNLKILKSECLQNLKQNIGANLDRYRTGDFSGLLDEITVDFEIDYSRLETIQMPDGGDTKDVENCVLVHGIFGSLSPFVARDERLWVQLCHGPLLDYTRKRWPIRDNEEDAIKDVKSHFFAGEKRVLEARNAAGRLYWLAYIASRVNDIPLEETLSLILHRQDVRQNIIERPTVLQDEAILIAIVHSLKKSRANDSGLYVRRNFRELQEKLNEYCGFVFVESLPTATVTNMVDTMISEILAADTGAT
jgi:hypothetical protein